MNQSNHKTVAEIIAANVQCIQEVNFSKINEGSLCAQVRIIIILDKYNL